MVAFLKSNYKKIGFYDLLKARFNKTLAIITRLFDNNLNKF